MYKVAAVDFKKSFYGQLKKAECGADPERTRLK